MRFSGIMVEFKQLFSQNAVLGASQIDLWKVCVQNLIPQATG